MSLRVRDQNDTLFVQSYIDDAIFSSANPSPCKEFAKFMQAKFETSLMGKLKFLLGIRIDQHPEAAYCCQNKYSKELLKKFDMLECSAAKFSLYPTCI